MINHSKVNIHRGPLITCEPAVKQVILHIDELHRNKFVLCVLDDDIHVFVKFGHIDEIKALVERKFEMINPTANKAAKVAVEEMMNTMEYQL
ncbi:hypothetical protein CspHIS471_0107360 [Cutaneotrichosporon sp. HIS471]|nr:hypothetical protein CspHIS471_0107360 [Cutaneotrichosporon sp. HIS471]